MASGVRKWNGAAIGRRVQAAAIASIDETTQATAADAEASKWWRSRRGEGLESQIASEGARPVALSRVRGRVGTTRTRGFYGLFLERKRPFLRPAADRNFPRLADRIRSRL